ncbi:MAG: oligosaccharide flippase family protein [Phycisphaerales bacterium]
MPVETARKVARSARSPRAVYAASMLGAQGLNGVAAFLIFRWVEPLAMGFWSSAQLLQLPLDALKMGVLSGLSREYPYLVGRGEQERAQQVVETGLAHSLAMSLVGLVIGAAAVLLLGRAQPMLGWALAATALAWAFVYFAQFVRCTFRTSSAFVRLGAIELGLAVGGVAALALVWAWGFDGLLARAVLLGAGAALVFLLLRPVRARPRFHRWAFAEMFRFGRHTYVTGYLLLVGQQAERALLLTCDDGTRLLGVYAPVLACVSVLQVIPGAIHGSSYPAFVEAYGRDHDLPKLRRHLLRQMRHTAVIMVGVSAAAAAGIGLLVHFALPKYEEALVPALIASAAGPFYAARMLATYWSALKRWPEYYLYTALQAGLPFVFIGLLLSWLPPLQAAAIGYVAAVAVSSCAMVLLVLRHGARQPAAPSTP